MKTQTGADQALTDVQVVALAEQLYDAYWRGAGVQPFRELSLAARCKWEAVAITALRAAQPPKQTGAEALRNALAELVAVKDLKDRADKISPVEPGCEKDVLMDEYRRRQPLAWTKARAALSGAPALGQSAGNPRVKIEVYEDDNLRRARVVWWDDLPLGEHTLYAAPPVGQELLPCPFCGGEPEGPYFVTGMAFDWWISCKTCKFNFERRGKTCEAEKDQATIVPLIAAWNRRAGQQGSER